MKHFIFDIDGTLLNTEKPLLLSWQKTLSDLGYNCSESEIKKLIYLPIEDIVKLTKINTSENMDMIWTENYALYQNTIDYYPGVLNVLKDLNNNPNITTGIITSRSKEGASMFFSDFGFSDYFSYFVFSDDTHKQKPAPDPMLKYIELTGADLNDCIYFGDTNNDIISAKSAGISAALCTWKGSISFTEKPDYVINSPNEILLIC